jgi:hypothetical protein
MQHPYFCFTSPKTQLSNKPYCQSRLIKPAQATRVQLPQKRLIYDTAAQDLREPVSRRCYKLFLQLQVRYFIGYLKALSGTLYIHRRVVYLIIRVIHQVPAIYCCESWISTEERLVAPDWSLLFIGGRPSMGKPSTYRRRMGAKLEASIVRA